MVLTPYLFSIAMLLCTTLIPVQGRVLDEKINPDNFNKTTVADAGNPDCFSKAVGVANPSIIPDGQLTASSYYTNSYKPAYGRLNFKKADGWCARTPGKTGEWLQVDLGKLFLVCAVATQGDSRYDGSHEWVTDFKLTYSHNGNTWQTYKDANGNEVEFHRKGESNGVDQHKLKPVYARYIRFYPTKRHKWNCLRVEVYGSASAISDCGVKLQSKRIVGGAHASPGEWRWHVQFAAQGYHCSGSLITSQWVITAAHCVEGMSASSIELTLGEHHLYQTGGTEQKYSVSKVISHPQYSFPRYDFALMKMKNSATINDHVGTICLPESATKLPVGTACWETGWGKTSHNAAISSVLKELEVIIVPPNSGRWHASYSEFITTTRTAGHGTCRGDSGGPVVHEQDGKWYLEGVHSWGRPTCGQAGYYDGQADVRAVLQWIKDTMKNN